MLQLTVAWIFVRLPDSIFARPGSAVSPTEAHFYRDVARIRQWKRLLPSGGRWVGSTFTYETALLAGSPGRRRFLLETRRSEAAHWTSVLATSVFLLWNPPWAGAVMLAAGAIFNVPCLVVQRYNRAALQRGLCRRSE